MRLPATFSAPPLSLSSSSRRRILKGIGALAGTGLLGSPLRLLAAPALAPGAASTSQKEYIGMVKLVPGTTVPQGWALCDGQVLPATAHPTLFASLGAAYGGDGRHTFALPDLRNDMAAWAGLAAAQAPGGVPIGQLCIIKVADAPAITALGAELRLVHQRRRLATA